jgi:hypothetical protein
MKKIALIILFFAVVKVNSQSEFKVLNYKDSTAIENAYISMNGLNKTITDKNGIFKIKSNSKFDSITISHISFNAKTLKKSELLTSEIIFLVEKNQQLDEVVINEKEVVIEPILPKQTLFSKMGHYKGHRAIENSEYVTFIPNSKNKSELIKNIVIETHKGYWGDPNKEYMPFKVNLYSVNESNGLPDKKLLSNSILTRKISEESKYVKVDISDYFIDFPESGIFICVETLSKDEYKDYMHISTQSPAFKIIKKTKKSKSVTYSRKFRNGEMIKDWIDEKYPPVEFVYNFGIEIEYYK